MGVDARGDPRGWYYRTMGGMQGFVSSDCEGGGNQWSGDLSCRRDRRSSIRGVAAGVLVRVEGSVFPPFAYVGRGVE